MQPSGRLVVVGAGDVGGEVARRWVGGGGEAVGFTASTARHQELAAAGVEPRVGEAAEILRPDDRVLLSTSGSESQRLRVEALAGTTVRRAVMTGSTGIYGAARGRIDEATPPGAGGRARAAAETEAAFRAWAPQGVILRLGGLYRRGRGPLQPLLRRGEPPSGPPDRALVLIHRDDAVRALLAALTHPHPDTIYLAVTPPAPRRDIFYREACRLHGLPEPSFGDPVGPGEAASGPGPDGTGAAAWYDVSRLRRDLLPDPAHPDWHEAVQG
jgi:nucleoside-diphosphate-sugar epimerase